MASTPIPSERALTAKSNSYSKPDHNGKHGVLLERKQTQMLLQVRAHTYFRFVECDDIYRCLGVAIAELFSLFTPEQKSSTMIRTDFVIYSFLHNF